MKCLSTLAKKYNLEKVDFIKCDIEGGEMKVFKDKEFFKKYSPKIIIETHYLHDYTEMTTPIVKNLLDKIGYSYKEVQQDGFDLPLLECVPKENK